MTAGRMKILCSTCGQAYRVVATDDPDDDVVYGYCDGCLIAQGNEPPPLEKEETKMDEKKKTLLEDLAKLLNEDDQERAHMAADDLLVEYIGDADIARAYMIIPKWFA